LWQKSKPASLITLQKIKLKRKNVNKQLICKQEKNKTGNGNKQDLCIDCCWCWIVSQNDFPIWWRSAPTTFVKKQKNLQNIRNLHIVNKQLISPG
jgi:hypothetical protein